MARCVEEMNGLVRAGLIPAFILTLVVARLDSICCAEEPAPAPKPLTEAEVPALVMQLGADDHEARAAASKRLLESGESVLEQLKAARERSDDPEVNKRLDDVLVHWSPEAKRARAFEAAPGLKREEARALFLHIEAVGHDFVSGKTPGTPDTKLLDAFRDDPNVYNIIYSRPYKDANGATQMEYRTLAKERMVYQQISKSENDAELLLGAARAGEEDPVRLWVAIKHYAPLEKLDDQQDGQIVVLFKRVPGDFSKSRR